MRALQEEEDLDRPRLGSDTEITLGMRSLLGIFFGLVLICGVFFGLGYSLGRGNSGVKPAAPATTAESKPATRTPIGPVVHKTDDSEPDAYTPGPNDREAVSSAASQPAPSAKPAATSATYPATTVVKQLTPQSDEKPVAAPHKPTPGVAATPTETSVPKPAPSTASTVATTPATSAPTPATATPGPPSMVQVAAISRQEDAEILVAALRKRGYSAVIRNDPKDSLLHIQIGPFATRDEARAMRAKLLADGYNAILK